MREFIAVMTNDFPNIHFTVGSHGSHAPGHPCGSTISSQTIERIRDAINRGATRIHMGNSLGGEVLAQTNSRFHGYRIRTINAYFTNRR